jgi:hypothetical protein
MSDLIILYNDVLPAFFLIPLIMTESEENKSIIHVNQENISDLYTAEENLATFNIISENDEIKNMFSFEHVNEDNTKSLNNEAKELLELVIQIPKLMEKINKLMWFFGGVTINIKSVLNVSDEQTGGSKNLITLFLFSFIYLLFLTPIMSFVINVKRTSGDFSNNQRNTIKLPIPSLENEDKYTDAIVNFSNRQNPQITLPTITTSILNELKSLEPAVDDFLMSKKIIEVGLKVDINVKSVDNFKKGLALLKIISFHTSLNEKIDILISDVLDTNKVDLGLKIANILVNVVGSSASPIGIGLDIINNTNGAFTSTEFEVARYATQHIIKVMKNDMTTQYGKINTAILDQYLHETFVHGGKKRKKSKKTKKITKRRNKKGKKSRNRRKNKKSLVFSYL